ncbi:choline transport protein [Ceratobasidium sp. AG-Ba]|nr:choline transport protein [Ceratobasidium sp. AG-Ba]
MVTSAYAFIREHYEPGDNIWLFGYSRGAYVARKVASLISRIGLEAAEDELHTRWGRCEKPVCEDINAYQSRVPIKCIGVWDTVGAIYNPLTLRLKQDLFGIPDTDLPSNVQHAFHAVAIHENRGLFNVTLFEPNQVTNLREIWFPGSHSDVGGGGFGVSDLPDVSLLWMIGEMKKIAKLPRYEMIYPRATRLKSFMPTNECVRDPLVGGGLVRRDPMRRPPFAPTNGKAINYNIHESVLYLQSAARQDRNMKKRMDEFGWVGPVSKNRVTLCSALERMKQAHMTALMTLKAQVVQRQIEYTSPKRYSIDRLLQDVTPRPPRSDSSPTLPTTECEKTEPRPTYERSLSFDTSVFSDSKIRDKSIDIMIFCDAETMDGRVDGSIQTNIWKLYQMASSAIRLRRLQTNAGEICVSPTRICLYMPGMLVGPKKSRWEKDAVELHDIWVGRAYMRLSAEYQPGDRIYLFGFSSGAVVVRKLAFVLNRLGIQKRIPKPAFQRVGGDLSKLIGKSSVNVRCLGAWDTNFSYLPDDSIPSIKQTMNPPNIEHVFHACALHENHRTRIPVRFKPELISDLKEVWFAGSTGDIGGGKEEGELWKISFLWMLNQLQEFADIPHDDVTFPTLQGLTLEPQDAFRSSPLYKRLVDHLEFRHYPSRVVIHAIVHTHLRMPTPEQPEIQEPGHQHLAYGFPLSQKPETKAPKPGHPLREPQVWTRLFNSSRLFSEA